MFNEEDNIRPFYDRMLGVMLKLGDRYDFEFLFTDNHSTDATFDRLAELSLDDPCVRVIRFSRNFGFQRSILTNYNNACGDAAIQLDVDLRDPPELIIEFVRYWEEGHKVVYGIRRRWESESVWLHGARKLFYRMIDSLSEDELPHDADDFRLVDRCVLDQLRLTSGQQPYLRGLIAAIGFNQIGITSDRAACERGTSKFNFWRLLGLALDGILHRSVLPLRLATYFGLALSTIAMLGALYYLIGKLTFREDWPEGLASTTILIFFSIGMSAVFLGIIGEYVGRIYKNVKRMPITIFEAIIDRTAEFPAKHGDEPTIRKIA